METRYTTRWNVEHFVDLLKLLQSNKLNTLVNPYFVKDFILGTAVERMKLKLSLTRRAGQDRSRKFVLALEVEHEAATCCKSLNQNVYRTQLFPSRFDLAY